MLYTSFHKRSNILLFILSLLYVVNANRFSLMDPLNQTLLSDIDCYHNINCSKEYSYSTQQSIVYKGGTPIQGPIHVYIIFYGNAWTLSTIQKIEHFVRTLDTTGYFSILQGYKDPDGKTISGPILLKPSITTRPLFGNKLKDEEDVQQIIKTFYPIPDAQGIYLVLGDKYVDHSFETQQFCNNYCAFHFSNQTLHYSFLIDPSACGACSPWDERKHHDSPNLDVTADTVVSILSHQLSEILINPITSKPCYTDSLDQEIGDKCNFYYGQDSDIKLDSNHNCYNHLSKGLKYKIQALWSIKKMKCSLTDE